MRNAHLILVLAASFAPFTSARAAPANLPETGQITCTDATGAVIPCASTGQDGDLRVGVAWPEPRFIGGVGDKAACVTDRLTGLMWVRAPDSSPMAWGASLAYANGLTLCGFSDWRLPNIRELESLVNSAATNPAAFLNTHGFANVQASGYWSSSSYFEFANNAWIVSMFDGGVAANGKSNNYYVWPVRAGQ